MMIIVFLQTSRGPIYIRSLFLLLCAHYWPAVEICRPADTIQTHRRAGGQAGSKLNKDHFQDPLATSSTSQCERI